MYAPLPPPYTWLADEPAPRLLVEMLRLHGLTEQPGAADNPDILALAHETGVADVYDHDVVPWCGLALGAAARRAGWDLPEQLLWARSWAGWGTAAPRAMLGDVVVFARPGGGHVGLYVGEDADAFHILGGNQGDCCDIRRFGRTPWRAGASFGVFAVRRCPWRIAQPANVRPVLLTAAGAPSSTKVT